MAINSKIVLIIGALWLIGCQHIPDSQPWPGGRIPFTMAGFTVEETAAIFVAMKTWEAAADNKISFILMDEHYGPTTTEPLYLIHNNEYMGAKWTGYNQNSINFILINSFRQGDLLHEFGHVLGLIHEICRPDRDYYMAVAVDKIIDPLVRSQFYYMDPVLYDYLKYPFDYQSLMMYSEAAFPGIIDAHGQILGSETISWIDAWKVRDIYSGEAENRNDR